MLAGDQKGGILSILLWDIGKKSFVDQVKNIMLKIEPESSLGVDGKVSKEGTTLVVTLNLKHSLSSLRVEDWKDRILDTLSILVEIATLETDNERIDTQTKVQKSLSSKTSLNVLMDSFVK